MKEARLAASLRLKRQLSQGEMAELVGKGAGQPLWQAQWSAYERNESEPVLAVIRSTAHVSGLDSCYLAFGTGGEGVATEPMEPGVAPVARPGPDPDRHREAAPPIKRRRGKR